MRKAQLLWVDLEMTGLSPEKDRILEVAAVATGWDLEVLGSGFSRAMVGDERAMASSRAMEGGERAAAGGERAELAGGERAEFTAVVKVPEELIAERMVGEFWEKNAEARAALVAQNAKGESAEAVEKKLLEFIDKWFGKKVFLAGNSIHQDRKFIDREWPEVARRLHYRMLDVSAWKIVFEEKYRQKFAKREEHRALSDIEGSISELKWYLERVDGHGK